MAYVLLNNRGYIVSTAPRPYPGEAWLEIDLPPEYDEKYQAAYKALDGTLILDESKKFELDVMYQAEEEKAAHHQTAGEKIEKLKAENKELKEYVELISDSVVDLAMRTLKEG